MSDHSDHNASPFHQLPPVVVALAVVIGGVEVMFQLAALGLIGGAQGVGWRLAAMRDYAVLDAIATAMWNNQVILWDHMLRLIAYSLIHVGGFHAVMVVVFVLALGNYVGRVFAPLAVLAVFFGSAILGALADTRLIYSF